MPRNGNGVYTLPATSWNPAVTGAVIESTGWNSTATDLAAAMTQSVSKDGQTVMTGNLPMGNNKLTGLANGAVATDSAAYGQVQAAQQSASVGTVGGTADAITLTVSPVILAYATGQVFQFTATGTNTGAVTVAVSGLAAKAVQANSAALVAGDIVSGRTYIIRYDGAQFQLFASHAAALHTDDIADSAVTLAKMDTTGLVGQVLTAAGGGGAPTWESQPSLAANLIINGGMQIDQRVNTTGQGDDAYCLDRWYTLLQTGTITVGRQTAQENGTPYNIRLTQAQAVAQRMGLAQIVESVNGAHCLGQQVAASARVRISASQAVRYAVLEWTSTADSVTSDFVNDWTSSNYSSGNFFIANITVTAIGALTPSANTWTDLPSISGTVSASMNNLIFFIWTEGTAAQNVTLDISQAQLVQGASAGAFAWPMQPAVLSACQRYYQKSFNQATKPATGTGVANAVIFAQTVGASTANNGGVSVVLPVVMRDSPSATLFNPVNANANAYNITTGADCSATISVVRDWRLNISFTSPGGSAAGNSVGVAYTLNAEL